MARIARVVVPGCPHRVTHPPSRRRFTSKNTLRSRRWAGLGNRRQRSFFEDDVYLRYKELLAEGCKAAGVEIWAYCLMPNHCHLILVPQDADGLHAALGEAHRRYTRMINARKNWTGYLWQGRFASVAMDESHLMTCVRLMSSKIPTERGWLIAPATGAGQVLARISQAATMDWCASSRA